jgi:hypothetical protein
MHLEECRTVSVAFHSPTNVVKHVNRHLSARNCPFLIDFGAICDFGWKVRQVRAFAMKCDKLQRMCLSSVDPRLSQLVRSRGFAGVEPAIRTSLGVRKIPESKSTLDRIVK